MASGRDVRDMLGLPTGGDVQKIIQKPRPKPTAATRRPRKLFIFYNAINILVLIWVRM